jgi:hypothetical protein
MAAALAREHFHVHRGVTDLEPVSVEGLIDNAGGPVSVDDCLCIFGNDGFLTDARSLREVALVREGLRERGIEEIGFATDCNGYTWAMLVLGDWDIQEELGELVWDAWSVACGLEPTSDPTSSNESEEASNRRD